MSARTQSRRLTVSATFWALPAVWALLAFVPMVAAAEPVSFSKQIAPLLLDNCQVCHGPRRMESGYRVDTFERTLHAGESETEPVTAGKPQESELLRRLTSSDVDERMPKDCDPFTPEQIALVRRWIEEGARCDAANPQAQLVTLVPPVEHPAAPQVYGQTLPITALAFSADGQELYVSGFREITVWNATTGELLRRIGHEGERTYALALSQDGKSLIAGSGTPGRLGEVRLFDPQSGSLEKILLRTTDVVFDVAPSPQDNRLAVASADYMIRVLDLESGQEKLALASHSDWVFAVAWNSDGTKLASASRDKTAKVFDVATGESLSTYSGHADAVRGVVFHPNGNQVYSSGADRRVHLWKAADGVFSSDAKTFGGENFRLASGGGEFLFVPSADKLVHQFELATLKSVRDYKGHEDWVLSVAYHAASRRMASGGFDGQVRVWDAADGKQIVAFVAAPK